MRRKLDAQALEQAIVAGLFLSAGGSGMKGAQRHRRAGEMALAYSSVELISIDEFADDDAIITATGVGAPGFAKAVTEPRDSVESARLLMQLTGPAAAVVPGHVPGLNAWLVAATLGLKLADTAGNGRGHPTVKMGGMGLASKPHVQLTQVGMGGSAADGSRLEVVARGNIVRTSNLMRQAAVINGGLVLATRGPLPVAYVREFGAAGAITFQLDLGAAMLAAKAGEARVQATVDFLKGRLLVVGEVTQNTVAYGGGFDLGRLVVKGAEGEVSLGVYNEYMTAELDGRRVATFPDMVGTLDPATGDPVAINELAVGTRCAVISSSKRNFPIGAGATDPAVYPEVEEAMGLDLQTYALDPNA